VSNRDKYLKKHAIDRVINVVISGHHESVYLARRKTTKAPIMGDLIHVKAVDITAAPWVLCRVTTVEGDTLPIYHLNMETVKAANIARPTSLKCTKEQVVKTVIDGAEITMMLRSIRPKVGQKVVGRPKFKGIIPEKWATYQVVNIDHVGCTRYHLATV
jgi:hypothetical protein